MRAGNLGSTVTGPERLAWALRLALSATLIAISVWGFSYSRRLVLGFSGPDNSPADRAFSGMGVWACWFLFFFPLAFAGVWLLKTTLHKMGAADRVGRWIFGGMPQSQEPSATTNRPFMAPGRHTAEVNDPHGLESLSPETIAQLQRSAARTAAVLGTILGALLVTVGACGLVYLLFFFKPMVGSSIQGAFAVERLSIGLAVASGLSFLLGLALLRRTFARENTAWLAPLHGFTRAVLQRWQLDRRRGRPGPQRPNPRQLR